MIMVRNKKHIVEVQNKTLVSSKVRLLGQNQIIQRSFPSIISLNCYFSKINLEHGQLKYQTIFVAKKIVTMFNHENYDHRLDRENIAERVPVKRAQKNQKETKQHKKKR